MRAASLFAITLLLAVSLAAHARGTARFGNRLVSQGDSVGSVRQVAGTPDRIVTLENEFGAATGERWEYYRSDGSTVLVTFRNGRVQDVEEVR